MNIGVEWDMNMVSWTDAGLTKVPAELEPKIVFLPDNLYQSLKVADRGVQDIKCLETMLGLLGTRALAMFVHSNYIYKTASDNFLDHEVIDDFIFYDLMDCYRDELVAKPHLTEQYSNLVKQIDALQITSANIESSYLRPTTDDARDAQYYVPTMLPIGENLYGVRLVAITGAQNDDHTKDLLSATVANIGVLSKSYSTKQIATFPYFSKYVQYC